MDNNEPTSNMTKGLVDHVLAVPPEPPQAAASSATEHIMSTLDSKEIGPPNSLSTTTGPASNSAAQYESGSDIPPTPLATKPRSNFRIALIVLALYLSEFVAALDATIVATAVPVITHELGSATGYTWIGGAYLLANAAAAPIWAKLSDIWGRRVIILTALSVFFASSAICATANQMQTLIAGRAIQGVAGGGLLLLVHVVISDLFSQRTRGAFMGGLEVVWATAGGLGPPLGGVFASLISWRWCFYINLPICGFTFVLIAWLLDVKHEQTTLRTGLKALDWFGIFSFLAFVLMLLLGLDFGGDVFPWDSAKVIALIVVGVCMLAVFIWTEAKVARYPLIPLALFKDSSNLASLGVGFCHGLAFIPAEYYFPLYLQAVKSASPIRSGVLLIPLIVATASTGVVTGFVMHRTGKFRPLIWLGTSILCLGNGLLILLDERSSIAEIAGLSIVFGIGSGMLFAPPIIAIQSRSEQQDVATATSTYAFVRSVALAISIIIGGVVFQNSMDTQADSLLRQSQNGGVSLSPSVIEKLRGENAAANVAVASQLTDPVQREVVQRAFADAIRNMWYLYVAVAALGVVCSAFVGKKTLSREHVETVTGIKKEKVKDTEHETMQGRGQDIEMA